MGERTAEPDAALNTPPVHTFLKPCIEDGYCGVFEVGGQLLTAAWLDDERMYLSDMEGSIRLLNVKTGEVRTVLEGLTHPQGMTVLDGRLYVSDLGNYRQLTMELGRCLEECQASAEKPCEIFAGVSRVASAREFCPIALTNSEDSPASESWWTVCRRGASTIAQMG